MHPVTMTIANVIVVTKMRIKFLVMGLENASPSLVSISDFIKAGV
jgi:hypothetical protein